MNKNQTHQYYCNKRGVAMVMVIVSLAILLLVAIPFSNSIRVEKRETQSELLNVKVRLASRGAFHYAASRLKKTCDNYERYLNRKPSDKTPDYDAIEEYNIDIELSEFNTKNSKGIMWSANIEDEQGKININSATPWLLGNIMASAMVTRTVGAYDTTIFVDSTINFSKNGGYLWVNGELISYKRTTGRSFLHCKRGLYNSSPRFINAKKIETGTLIIDARAYKICRHRISRHPGKFTPFRTIEEIKQIADVSAYAIDNTLFDKIEPMLTVYSLRNNHYGWIHTQKIKNGLPGINNDKGEVIKVNETSFYRPGMTVKLSQNNQNIYALILEVGTNHIVIDERITKKFEKDIAQISVLEVHPININSAHPKIVYALFKGIRDKSNWIDSKQAGILTSAIYANRRNGIPLKSHADFKTFLIALRKKLLKANVKDLQGKEALSKKEIDIIMSSCYSLAQRKNRFAGIDISPYPNSYIQQFPPFAPVIYKNHDTYSIESTGVLNSSTGVPIAKHTSKKIITVTPLERVRWRFESQKNFEFYKAQLPSYRVISWPNFVKHFEVFPAQDWNKKNTGLSLDTLSVPLKLPQGGKSHEYYPWNDTHEGVVCPGKDSPSLRFPLNNLEIAPGALSFWFYPLSGAKNYTIFDIGNSRKENRIVFLYEKGILSLRVYDATLSDKCAQINYKIKLEKKWYHIIASWYSTHIGGLALWVDGKPCGLFSYKYDHDEIKLTLQKKLKITDKFLYLSNTSKLEKVGVIKIGSEIIEYSNISGNILQIREKYTGYELDQLRRGVRRSTIREHESGAIVSPFGYSDAIEGDVFPASELSSDLADETLYTKLTDALDKNNTIIKVKDASKFQQSGYLLIADIEDTKHTEIVSYTLTSSKSFLNCTRGQLSTDESSFPEESYVFPISIQIKNNKLYPDSGMVQIGSEWIYYNQKTGDNFLILDLDQNSISKCQSTGKFNPSYRSVSKTMAEGHSFGDKVLPVFKTQYGFAGRYDEVTIIHGNKHKQKEKKQVKWSYGSYIAFSDDVKNTYKVGSGSRILKFPSGELPSQENKASFGNSIKGKASPVFMIDELHFIQGKTRINYFVSKNTKKDDNSLTLNSVLSLPFDAGIIKVGDEYLSYENLDFQGLIGLKRRFLKSEAATYSIGTPVFPIFFIPVTSLHRTISLRTSQIPLRSFYDFPDEGYIKCDNEIIGYNTKKGSSVAMPVSDNRQGLLRGAFGTRPIAHASGTIVYYFPVRYWDRCMKNYDGTEQAFFEASKSAPGALWKKITWQEKNPSPRYLGVKILARLDGKPDWKTSPTNTKGGIYQFTNPRKPNTINLKGDTLEVRVYFQYKKGAYEKDFWKEKVMLESLFIEYVQPTYIWQNSE